MISEWQTPASGVGSLVLNEFNQYATKSDELPEVQIAVDDGTMVLPL